jgi:hypothetical protein
MAAAATFCPVMALSTLSRREESTGSGLHLAVLEGNRGGQNVKDMKPEFPRGNVARLATFIYIYINNKLCGH